MSDIIAQMLSELTIEIFKSAPYWAPIALAVIFWKVWIYYRRMDFITNVEWTTIEIKMPKEITKTPLAMELVLNALYQNGMTDTFIERWWYGNLKPWFSLEMVSIEGQVKFMITTHKFFKKLIETQIYAQYPDVEINEVEDYTQAVHYGEEGSDWQMWGGEFKLTKADPYPIKTYVDYGLDKEGVKEEYKIDPITPVLEYLGSIGKDEQIWIQIMVRKTEDRFRDPGKLFKKRGWVEEGKDLINSLMREASEKSSKRQAKKSGEQQFTLTMLTDREKDVITAIERSLSKPGFDCGMRGVYLAKKDVFQPVNIAGLVGSIRQYNAVDLNGFKPTRTTGTDYPWQDYKKIRVSRMKTKMFDAYRKRSLFYWPYKRKPFVLNAEELATIYHFPGGVAETPSFERIDSKKAEPPFNLPT